MFRPSNQELVDEKIIPHVGYENMNFVAFDVESLMTNDVSPGVTGLLNIHRLATIGLVSNFGEKNIRLFLWSGQIVQFEKGLEELTIHIEEG